MHLVTENATELLELAKEEDDDSQSMMEYPVSQTSRINFWVHFLYVKKHVISIVHLPITVKATKFLLAVFSCLNSSFYSLNDVFGCHRY